MFALCIEDVPEQTKFSFRKELVDAVVFGKLGVANTAKTIGNSHRKATLVFMDALPQQVQDKLRKGRGCYNTGSHFHNDIISNIPTFSGSQQQAGSTDEPSIQMPIVQVPVESSSMEPHLISCPHPWHPRLWYHHLISPSCPWHHHLVSLPWSPQP